MACVFVCVCVCVCVWQKSNAYRTMMRYSYRKRSFGKPKR